MGLIKQLKADLLVVGFMGHSQLYERIIGGTADRLVRLAPCSVLVVK
jgi:nucleotide-binding universal stress UspA family protein